MTSQPHCAHLTTHTLQLNMAEPSTVGCKAILHCCQRHTYHGCLILSIFLFIPAKEKKIREYIPLKLDGILERGTHQSSGMVASGSSMYSGPSSIHPSGLTASGSSILGGASSSQSSGLTASGSGILQATTRE